MKEVGWIPHIINILSIVSGIALTINQVQNYRNQTFATFTTVNVIVNNLSSAVKYCYMIRLIRVQVQIMSEIEHTKIIITKIHRSYII